jgi:hypothetical protein
MKVLNLQCRHHHNFEGWFGSEEDYQSQRSRGLVSCPLCGDAEVTKLPSAPRLNLGATASAKPHTASAPLSEPMAQDAAPSQGTNLLDLQQMQAAWMSAVKNVLANTEDVGAQFADEARKIHYGEAQERGIRGQATLEETQALLDEGIDVMPLPVPESLKGPLQ